MSTFRNPVGPQPSKVYWRRRLAVVVGIVVVIVVIILIVARPGSGKPAAVPTDKASNSSSAPTTTAAACKPSNVQVIAITDSSSYAPGVDPMLSLSITNTGSTACSFKDGSDVQNYEITSGTDKIWSSKDCQTGAVAHTSVLEPGKAVSSTPFAWNRTRSNAADCAATNAPSVIAGGASYHLTAVVNGRDVINRELAAVHPEVVAVSLAQALQTGDSVQVALALRNSDVVMPMLPSDGEPQVRVFRRDDADKYMLLLFSSPETYAAMIPDEDDPLSTPYDAAALLDFLTQNLGVLETVWFDVAGPNSMQATPEDIIAALQL